MEGKRSDAPTLGVRQRREGFIGYPVICRPQGLGAKGRRGEPDHPLPRVRISSRVTSSQCAWGRIKAWMISRASQIEAVAAEGGPQQGTKLLPGPP